MSHPSHGRQVRQQLEAIANERDYLRARVDRLEGGITVFLRYLTAHNGHDKLAGEILALTNLLEDRPCPTSAPR